MPEQLNHPPLTSCESSALDGHAFDPATQTLYLKFKSGTVYSYPEVSNDLYEGLKSAESVGRFYGANIKGKYTGVPVPAPAKTDADES